MAASDGLPSRSTPNTPGVDARAPETDRIFRISDSVYAGLIRARLVNETLTDLWLTTLVYLNVIVQTALLLAAGGLSARSTITFGFIGLAFVGIAASINMAGRFNSPASILRTACASASVFLMDLAIVAAPVINTLSDHPAEPFFLLAVIVGATASTVPLTSKLIRTFMAGKGIIILALVIAIATIEGGPPQLALHPVLIVLAALWSSGYTLQLLFVRSLHLYFREGAARNELNVKSDQLQEALDAEHRASMRVQSEFEVRERFLRYVSHDLRQPVNALGLLLYELKSKKAPGERDDIIRLCQDCVLSANAVIEDVLTLPELSSHAIPTDIRPVPLERIFERLRTQFAESARTRGLRLSILPTRAIVATDERALERILRNLISNAIRYTNHGGIVVGPKWSMGRLGVVIADTGPGIPEAARQRMFVEGYRLSRGGGAELGYGLGLAIVRELSLAIGATISVETGKRHGTVFRVDLASIPVAVGRENADRLADVDFSGRHILIVDDDRLTCEALQRRLSDCDALVEAFHDINEIRTLLASGTVEADLFILDYHLAPDLTARNLLDAWTGIGYEQVIVITGHADLMLVRDMELKGLRVLKKPVDPADLVRVCQVVLQQPEETGPPHAGMEQQTRSPLPTRRSAGDSESVSAAKDPPHDA